MSGQNAYVYRPMTALPILKEMTKSVEKKEVDKKKNSWEKYHPYCGIFKIIFWQK